LTNCGLMMLMLLTLTLSSSWGEANTEIFPSVLVNTLTDEQLQLPGDLRATPSLFIVGFSKASREETQPWSKILRAKYATEDLAIYSVSVLEDVPRFIRGIVTRSIRKSVPDALHGQFLLVTKQGEQWKKVTNYSDDAEDAAYLLLLNREHMHIWRFHGTSSLPNQQLVELKIAGVVTK